MSACRTLRTTAVLLGALALSVLSGCGSSDGEVPDGSPAAVSPATPLEQDAESVRTALQDGVGTDDVTAGRVRAVLNDAGWTGDSVEVGQNQTPTGLDVDKIEAGVHTANGCVVADVRPDGTVTVSSGQPLATGKCLVGHSYSQ